MLRHVRLSYANVVSTLCLFIVLGGSAYAATTITGRDVRNGSLTGADVRDHSLRARDFRRGSLPAGPQGAKGAPGAPGAPALDPPAQVRAPAGRLLLPGVGGDGPGGAIVVRSVAWSSAMTGYDIGTDAGSPTIGWGTLAISKPADRSSPALWKLAASGQHMAHATLQLLAPGATVPYATYTLTDVTVKQFSTAGSGDGRQDELRLAFAPSPPPALAFAAAAPRPKPDEPVIGQIAAQGIAAPGDLVLDGWDVTGGSGGMGGGAGGTTQLGAFAVSQAVGADSPALLAHFAAGQHFQSVTIKLLQPGSASVYTTYVLTDAIISSYELVGDARPLERIGFDAGRIESTTPVAGGQPIHACWDRKLNAPC